MVAASGPEDTEYPLFFLLLTPTLFPPQINTTTLFLFYHHGRCWQGNHGAKGKKVLLNQELLNQAVLIKDQSKTIASLQNKPKGGITYKPDPPPHFFGDKRGLSAREWLFQTQMFLGLMEDAKYSVQFATTYFRGPAATWWFNKVNSTKSEEFLTWSDWEIFAGLLKKEFEPVNPVIVAQRRLDNTKQRHSVQQYVKEFRDITQQFPGITSEELLHRLIAGLKENVEKEVDKAEPVDLESAIRLAEKVECYKSQEDLR